ncbi:MAG: hypothetical protein LBL04_05950 [Bacteroidales bacterium]|jgi:hypothetical protein|nr:hypothetical protein [Bacteroidales bacterium]
MTDRQDAKLNMYLKVLNVCDEWSREYAGAPAMVSAVDELRQRTLDIQLATKQQKESNPKGATKEKGSALDRMTELSLRIADPLYVYGFNTGNSRLMEHVNVNKQMFYNAHDQEALTLAKMIADKANVNVANLPDYGINASDIAELDAAIAQVEKLINAPAGVIGERKLRTGSLRELFVAADSIVIDKLDRLIRVFRTLSPEFFALYGNARNVVNTAARKRKPGEPENEN